MESFAAILFATVFLAGGIALIYGTKKRVAWLIDPDESNWLCYSQALIKKMFGK